MASAAHKIVKQQTSAAIPPYPLAAVQTAQSFMQTNTPPPGTIQWALILFSAGLPLTG